MRFVTKASEVVLGGFNGDSHQTFATQFKHHFSGKIKFSMLLAKFTNVSSGNPWT